MKEQEPQPTIINQLNNSLKDEALEDMDVPTVQSIAESMGIDETTLYSWLHNDVQFATELHAIKRLKEINREILEKFPELAWTEEEEKLIGEENLEAKMNAVQIFFVLAEAKDRHFKSTDS